MAMSLGYNLLYCFMTHDCKVNAVVRNSLVEVELKRRFFHEKTSAVIVESY